MGLAVGSAIFNIIVGPFGAFLLFSGDFILALAVALS